MLYEEFRKLTGREDLSDAYDALEQLYMSVSIDKQKFCEYVKPIPKEFLLLITRSYSELCAATVKANEAETKFEEKAKADAETIRDLRTQIHAVTMEKEILELGVLFDPEETTKNLRAEYFTNYPEMREKALALNII